MWKINLRLLIKDIYEVMKRRVKSTVFLPIISVIFFAFSIFMFTLLTFGLMLSVLTFDISTIIEWLRLLLFSVVCSFLMFLVWDIIDGGIGFLLIWSILKQSKRESGENADPLAKMLFYDRCSNPFIYIYLARGDKEFVKLCSEMRAIDRQHRREERQTTKALMVEKYHAKLERKKNKK